MPNDADTALNLDVRAAAQIPGAAAPPLPAALSTTSYDPSRDRETVRSRIALWLVFLLGVIVCVPFVLLALRTGCRMLYPDQAVCTAFPVQELIDTVNLLLTPVIGLVGAVTGFYFGENKARS